jgi:hypothetical protein
MMARWLIILGFGAGTLAVNAAPTAQAPAKTASVVVRVTEAAGIRRNEYPVRATLSLPQGALDGASHARLKLAEADVTAQYTAASTWPDGSVRSLDVDFNASFNPSETREYRVDYGPAIASTAPAGRGLSVVEADEAIQVGSLRFNKRGAPLLLSANYRNEFIGKGSNGIAIVDANGVRHDLSTSTDLKVDLRKRGPLMVAIQYSGTYATPFTLLLEMPNSKAWLKWTFEVTDTAKRVRSLEISTPFAFGAFPWLWDVATQNDSYGAFRGAMDGVQFTQVIEPQSKGATGWHIDTRVQGAMRPYETSSTPGRPAPSGPGGQTIAKGWGHFQGPNIAVAFAIGSFGTVPGTYTIGFDGQGQSTFTFAQTGNVTTRRLVLYQHYVSTPVPIGAVTSPASMVNPPVVVVK